MEYKVKLNFDKEVQFILYSYFILV